MQSKKACLLTCAIQFCLITIIIDLPLDLHFSWAPDTIPLEIHTYLVENMISKHVYKNASINITHNLNHAFDNTSIWHDTCILTIYHEKKSRSCHFLKSIIHKQPYKYEPL